MSQRSIKWLYEELPGLVASGVVSPETALRLREHYGELREVSRANLAVLIFGILGAALIGSGIILIIAHNWEVLSRPTRTMLAFLPLVVAHGIGAWVLAKRPDSVPLREGITVFNAAAIGTSIALVGQIYHLPSNQAAFFLTWSLLLLPMVYLFRSTSGALMYLFGILLWLVSGNNLRSTYEPAFWPLSLLVVPYLVMVFRKTLRSVESNVLARASALYLAIGMGFAFGRGQQELMAVTYASLFAGLVILGGWWPARGIRNPFSLMGALGALGLMLMFTFDESWRSIVRDPYSGSESQAWSYGLSGFVLGFGMPILVFALAARNFARDRAATIQWLSLPVVTIFCVLIAQADSTAAVSVIVFNLYTAIFGIVLLVSGIQQRALASANFGLVMITSLAIMRFFDADLPFILRGTVFIVVGVLFLVTNVALLRRLRTTEARA